ncbi:MAG: hypothetical protein U5K69_18730 [Balneolaceae bacterium]|nr:hypothetical protein [Balneolaceae bacterium]
MSLDLAFWKEKRILITGHTGFKGSWMSYWLALMGAKVKGIALEPSSNLNLFDILSIEDKIESCILDISNFEHLKEEMKQF